MAWMEQETTNMYWGVISENSGVMTLIYFSQPFSADSISLSLVYGFTVCKYPDDFIVVI